MKTKLMTIFAILAVMMTIVGCKPDSITEEEEQKVVDEVTIDLTRNDWESVRVTNGGEYDGMPLEITTTRTLHFTDMMVISTYNAKNNVDSGQDNSQKEGSYTVSKDGKTVIVTIGKDTYTLSYSKEKLTGFWGSNYLEFLIIPRKN